METTVKQRLIEYLNYKKIGQNKFEKMAGISNGYISNIKESIGTSILTKVFNASKDLNPDWLLYGEGEMLKTSPGDVPAMPPPGDEAAHVVPLLPLSAQGGPLNDFVLSVREADCEKVVSPIPGADLAITVSGDSMAPEYPNGSRLLIKRINEKAFIEWGKTYVLDTCNGSVIKRIVPSAKEGFVKCLSINTDPIYAPFEVALSDIYGIYKVLLCMSIK